MLSQLPIEHAEPPTCLISLCTKHKISLLNTRANTARKRPLKKRNFSSVTRKSILTGLLLSDED